MDLPPVDINDVLFYLAEKPPAIIQHAPKKRDNLESLVKKIKEKRKKQLASEKRLTSAELEKKALDLIEKKYKGWIWKCKERSQDEFCPRYLLDIGYGWRDEVGRSVVSSRFPSNGSCFHFAQYDESKEELRAAEIYIKRRKHRKEITMTLEDSESKGKIVAFFLDNYESVMYHYRYEPLCINYFSSGLSYPLTTDEQINGEQISLATRNLYINFQTIITRTEHGREHWYMEYDPEGDLDFKPTKEDLKPDNRSMQEIMEEWYKPGKKKEEK